MQTSGVCLTPSQISACSKIKQTDRNLMILSGCGVHNQPHLNGKYLIGFYVHSIMGSLPSILRSGLWLPDLSQHFRELLNHEGRIQFRIIYAAPKVCDRQQQAKCYLEGVD